MGQQKRGKRGKIYTMHTFPMNIHQRTSCRTLHLSSRIAQFLCIACKVQVGVDKGCEDLAADCAGALRPGAASHLGETPFLEGFLQVGMGIRGGVLALDGYGTAGDGRRLLRKGQF